mgnify:CR=1 FL=1
MFQNMLFKSFFPFREYFTHMITVTIKNSMFATFLRSLHVSLQTNIAQPSTINTVNRKSLISQISFIGRVVSSPVTLLYQPTATLG